MAAYFLKLFCNLKILPEYIRRKTFNSTFTVFKCSFMLYSFIKTNSRPQFIFAHHVIYVYICNHAWELPKPISHCNAYNEMVLIFKAIALYLTGLTYWFSNTSVTVLCQISSCNVTYTMSVVFLMLTHSSLQTIMDYPKS